MNGHDTPETADTTTSEPREVGSSDLLARCSAALDTAVETIKAWHGPDAWDIYLNHSPEMTRIRRGQEAVTQLLANAAHDGRRKETP